jgi:hypothetical protein
MKRGFPQFALSAKLGDLGVNIVSRIVGEDFGWLFKRNHEEHDFGIDAQIEVVTDEGTVTGQMLACQIKCGKSFLRESNRWGYVYRGETKHFNYLANYPLPVIIIICDPESREAYWIRFRAIDAQVSETGWKLTVPFGNRLSLAKAELQAFLPGLNDHLSEMKEYWRLNNMLFRFEVIIFMIDVQEVKDMDVSRAKDFRRRLCSTKELAYHCQGKIEVGFYGYDDDPRELFEIDEVKRYVAVLDQALPELFFFARSEEPAITLMLFVFCLAGVGWEGERSTPGNPHKVVVDHGTLGPFLERHFTYLNYISEWVGLSEGEIERISKSAAKTMGMPTSEPERM